MAGSTQLKPLLLPTLAGDTMSLPSSSAASSPRSWPVLGSVEADPDNTILADEANDVSAGDNTAGFGALNAVCTAPGVSGDGGPGPAYAKTVALTAEEESLLDTLSNVERGGSDLEGFGLSPARQDEAYAFDDETTSPEEQHKAATTTGEHDHNSCSSLQKMPMPSTPDSLDALPRPLFSPAHRDPTVTIYDLQSRLMSKSPSASPQDPINLRKRRKPSLSGVDSGSPDSKVQRRQRRHSSVHEMPHALGSPIRRTASDPDMQDRAHTHHVRKIRSCDNFVEMLRQRNFAAKPLAALTIRTVYQILVTCTSTVRDFRRDPFALARKVLANAWYMNWKVLGKVSWWVLGLFVQPRPTPRGRAPIEWDQYDGESIASRYCGSLSDEDRHDDSRMSSDMNWRHRYESQAEQKEVVETEPREPEKAQKPEKPGWGRSLFLWGKFSAALMLAVGGAVIKGPSEMLKDVRPPERHRTSKHRHYKSRTTDPTTSRHSVGRQSGRTHAQKHAHDRATIGSVHEHIGAALKDSFVADFDFRSDTQLDSSTFLDQIQQTDIDSTLRAEQYGRRHIDSLFTPSATDSDSIPSRRGEALQALLMTPQRSLHTSDTKTSVYLNDGYGGSPSNPPKCV